MSMVIDAGAAGAPERPVGALPAMAIPDYGRRFVTFANTQFGLWLLSTVVVGLVSYFWSEFQAAGQTRQAELKRIEMLDLEIQDRLYYVADGLAAVEISEFGDLQKIRFDDPQGALIAEFKERPVKGLIAELEYLSKKSDRDNMALNAASVLKMVDRFEQCQRTRTACVADFPDCNQSMSFAEIRANWEERLRAAADTWPRAEQLGAAGPPVTPPSARCTGA